MAWPTDSLTKTNFDAGTDSPASARAELEALYDHVKLISAEVTDGATVWHSGNDGATSGLDADLLDGQEGSYYTNAGNLTGTAPLAIIPTNLTGKNADQLDGQEGSYYQNASNLNAGTVPLARLSGITATELASNSVGQAEISAGAVHQGELYTGWSEVSTTATSENLTLPGGEYGFYPNFKGSISTVDVRAQLCNEINSLLAYASRINLGDSQTVGTAYASQRYVNSSPPHKILNIDYKDFIFIKLKPNGDITSTWFANDPPWYHNGPTKVSPNYKGEKGKKLRRDRIIPPEILELKTTDPANYYKELVKVPFTVYEITPEIKNADIGLIPHPFDEDGDRILIIEPNQSGVYIQLCDLFAQGESICEIIHNGYLKIDNTEIPVNGKPPGVPMHRIKWKKT